MKLLQRLAPAALLVGWLLITLPAFAASPIIITKLPHTITAPGRYVIVKSLTYSGTTHAIDVQADDVSIDLQGWTITATGPSSLTLETHGIHADTRHNLAIRNGTIRGFLRGVYLEGEAGSGHLVENMVVDGSTYLGIQVKGSGCIVRRNTVSNVGGSTNSVDAYGIDVTGEGMEIIDNKIFNIFRTVPSNLTYAIRLLNCDSPVVQGNRIQNPVTFNSLPQGYGVYVTGGSFSLVTQNLISGVAFGIDYVTSSAHIYRDNTFTRILVPITNPSNGPIKDGGGNVSSTN